MSQKGGYYYNKNITTFLDSPTKKEIMQLINVSKIINSDDTINIMKVYEYIVKHSDKYENILLFLSAYYNPYHYYTTLKQKYCWVDHNGNLLRKNEISETSVKCIQIDHDLVCKKYTGNIDYNRYYNRIPYEKILDSIAINEINDDHYKNKINFISCELLARDNFINTLRKISSINNNIAIPLNIFYNSLNEPTVRSNVLSQMVNTGTIHIFFNLLHDKNFLDILNFLPKNITEFNKLNSIFTNLCNDTINIGDNNFLMLDNVNTIVSNFTRIHKNAPKINAYNYVFSYIDKTLRKYRLRLTNYISIEKINNVFIELPNMTLFSIIKSLITQIMTKCKNICIENNKIVQSIHKISSSKDINAIKNGINEIANHEKHFKRDDNLLFTSTLNNKHANNYLLYNKLIYAKTIINDLYRLTNPNSKFDMNYSDTKIRNDIELFINEINLNVYDGSITKKIFLNDFKKEVISTYSLYNNILKRIMNYCKTITSNDELLKEAVETLKKNKQIFNMDNNKLCFHKNIIGILIFSSKISSKTIIFDEIFNNIIIHKNNDDIIKIPFNGFANIVFSDISLEIKNTRNSISGIFDKINNEISLLKNGPVCYYMDFILDLIKILYHLNNVNIDFGTKYSVGNTIPYMYVMKILNNIPLLTSSYTIYNNLFGDLSKANHGKFHLDEKNKLNSIISNKYLTVRYSNITGVSDCVESVVRDMINVLILDDNNEININLLPPNTLSDIKHFYQEYDRLNKHYDPLLDKDLREKWMNIFNTTIKNKLNNIYPTWNFFNESKSKYQDLRSSYINFTIIISIIFNVNNNISRNIENAKQQCVNNLNSIFGLFNKQANFIFEDTKNTMRIVISDDYDFTIYDGHSHYGKYDNYRNERIDIDLNRIIAKYSDVFPLNEMLNTMFSSISSISDIIEVEQYNEGPTSHHHSLEHYININNNTDQKILLYSLFHSMEKNEILHKNIADILFDSPSFIDRITKNGLLFPFAKSMIRELNIDDIYDDTLNNPLFDRMICKIPSIIFIHHCLNSNISDFDKFTIIEELIIVGNNDFESILNLFMNIEIEQKLVNNTSSSIVDLVLSIFQTITLEEAYHIDIFRLLNFPIHNAYYTTHLDARENIMRHDKCIFEVVLKWITQLKKNKNVFFCGDNKNIQQFIISMIDININITEYAKLISMKSDPEYANNITNLRKQINNTLNRFKLLINNGNFNEMREYIDNRDSLEKYFILRGLPVNFIFILYFINFEYIDTDHNFDIDETINVTQDINISIKNKYNKYQQISINNIQNGGNKNQQYYKYKYYKYKNKYLQKK